MPAQLPGLVTSLTSTTVGAAAQLSVAVGAVKTGRAGHSIVTLAPAALMVGAVVSCTVMTWVQVFVLLDESTA